MLKSICCLQSSKAACWGCRRRKGIPTIAYGHLWSLLSCIHQGKHRDSKSKIKSWAFSRPDAALPNTPATANDTGAAEQRIRRTLLSGHSALCFTALHALYTHTSSGAALLPVLAKDSCCFLALCWHLPTSSNSQEDTFLCSSLCAVLLAVGSKRTKCYSSRPWGASSECGRDMREDESQWFITV